MIRIKLLFITVFFINFQCVLNAQEISYSLRLPASNRVIESYVLLDNSAAYFLTEDGEGNYRFYMSSILNDINMSAAIPIDSINSKFPVGTKIKGFCLSADNTMLLFSANLSGGLGGFDLYRMQKNGKSWTMPENLGKPINSLKDEFEPSISADGNTIYFTRPIEEENDYSNDFDCKAIYVSEKNINGEWEDPTSITKPINLGCECNPRIAPDNKTLYYSSVRDNEDLGFDIYYTQQIAKKNWKTPQKIDTLSTEDNDFALSFPATQDFYIYSRLPQKFKEKSISSLYRTIIPSPYKHEKLLILEGKISDLYTNKPIGAKIEVSNPQTKRVLFTAESNSSTGLYYLILPEGASYDLSVYNIGYSYKFENYDVSSPVKTSILRKDFSLYSSISLFLNVFDAEDFSALDATISVKKQSTGKEIKTSLSTERKGQYVLGLSIGEKYSIRVESENHLAYEMPFSLKENIQFSNFERDVELMPTYENIEFDVSDMETDVVLDSIQIMVVDAETGNEVKTFVSKNKAGKYELKLKKGKKYKVKVKAPKDYAFYNTEIDLNKAEAPTKMDVKLEPLTATTKLTFDAIQFETNSAEIDVNSFTQLSELVELLLDNPNMKVEISAHTDDIGSSEYNQRLSDKRAQSVVDYLAKNKVKEEQLIAKGYGESTPIVANDSDENRKKNRRVELRILEVDINEKN